MKKIGLFALALIFFPSICPAQEVPQNPKSDADCDAWSRQFQTSVADKLSVARTNDAKCKQTYSGSFFSVRERCPNVSSDPVKKFSRGVWQQWQYMFSQVVRRFIDQTAPSCRPAVERAGGTKRLETIFM
jgi:hypothetical protein